MYYDFTFTIAINSFGAGYQAKLAYEEKRLKKVIEAPTLELLEPLMASELIRCVLQQLKERDATKT